MTLYMLGARIARRSLTTGHRKCELARWLWPLRVESTLSKFSEADIQTGSTDSLFSKPPGSGMAEEQPVVAIALTVSKVSISALRERPLSGSVITRVSGNCDTTCQIKSKLLQLSVCY
jgi:hypothetical protein